MKVPVSDAAKPHVASSAGAASVDVVVPVYNEARALPGCIEALHRYLSESFPLAWAITIVDNASTDETLRVAEDLASRFPGVSTMHLDRKGRGLALRTAWLRSTADIVAYMDVDLSTGLDALLPLVAPLVSGHSDVAIGSRLAPGARTVRGPKRELVSRCYNFLLRSTFRVRFRDAQCGFKAMRTDIARALLPAVKDNAWFFDTELLLLAEYNGLRVAEVPVDWVEDVDTRVDVTKTALDDLRGMIRVARAQASDRAKIVVPRRGAPRPQHPDAVIASKHTRNLWQVSSFVVIGAVSTLLYGLLYFIMARWLTPAVANFIALLVAAVANTEANRRFTFDVRDHVSRRHGRGILLFVAYYVITQGSVWLLQETTSSPSRALQAVILVLASLLATALRFSLMRRWVFRRVAGARPAAVDLAVERPELTPVAERASVPES